MRRCRRTRKRRYRTKFDTHSSRCYQDIMTFFISLYIVLGTRCVHLLSAEPEIYSVSGPVGSTAVLPCQLTSGDTETLYIKWQIKFKTDYKTVFEQLGEESYQGEGYEGRVNISVEELRKGNCSLVMRDLRLNDTDLYTSYQAVTNTKSGVSIRNNSYQGVRHTKRDLSLTKNISRVHLTVHDRPEETPDKHSDSSDKTEETPDINSDSSDNGGNKLQYWWFLVLSAVVLLGLGVWYLKKRNTNNVL